jgi:hypothetical protein
MVSKSHCRRIIAYAAVLYYQTATGESIVHMCLENDNAKRSASRGGGANLMMDLGWACVL